MCPEEGLALETCADVAACLERLASAESATLPYNVLQLDLLLPHGRSGTEVLETSLAQPHRPLPPVVICSAVSSTELTHYRLLIDARGAPVIAKPFDADALLAAVRAAARRGKKG